MWFQNIFQLFQRFVTLVERDRDLTGSMLLTLTQMIDGRTTLQMIAIKGLQMDENIVRREINNHPLDITTAAYNTLSHWRKKYGDSKVAYATLCNALRSVNMDFYINAL